MNRIKYVIKYFINRLRRRKYRKNLDIDSSARLHADFSVNFLVSPEDRRYVKIGARCFLNAQITFESKDGAVEMGDRVYMGGCAIICRNSVIIGNDVTMAWGVTIYDHNSNSFDWYQRAKVVEHFYETYGSARCYDELDWSGVASAPIVIEDKVWIGFDVVLLKGIRVGEGAIIGARSVVTRNVDPYTVVAGNPAVFVKHIER